MTERIEGFTNEYRFLSNFYPTAVRFEGLEYPTVEHAYQAAKSVDPIEREYVRAQSGPREAKRAGRNVTLREGWEAGVDVEVMRQLIQTKFGRISGAQAAALKRTGDAVLVETNTWHDQHWGDCVCGHRTCEAPGENLLGVILMEVRNKNRETVRLQEAVANLKTIQPPLTALDDAMPTIRAAIAVCEAAIALGKTILEEQR